MAAQKIINLETLLSIRTKWNSNVDEIGWLELKRQYFYNSM